MEGLEERTVLSAVNGGSWQFPNRITYSFVPDGTSVGGVPSSLYATLNAVAPMATWQAQFEKAAALWSSFANINLSLVSDNGAPLGSAGNQQGDPNFGDIRIAAAPQANGTLAFALLPPPYNGGSNAGDIVLNSNISWKIGSDYDLESVALHEIGHALGLDHSALSTAVMYAYYNGVKQSVTTDDALGIQSVYGAFPTDLDLNRILLTATNITPQINNNQVAISGLNLAGTSDYDWWYVTVPASTTGTMTVSMQSANLSSVSPRLVIYNASNLSQSWQSTLPNSFGATATLSIPVTAGQGFYVRTSAASALGSYGSYALLANFGSQPQAPVAPPVTVVAAAPDAGGGASNEIIGFRWETTQFVSPQPNGLLSALGSLGLPLSLITMVESAYTHIVGTVTYGTLSGYGENLTATTATSHPASSLHHHAGHPTHHAHVVSHHTEHSHGAMGPHHS